MSTTTTFPKKTEILKIVKEMDCNSFLLEFGSITQLDEAENLLDMNEGMVNVAITVQDGRSVKDIFILFIDGQFDSYAY